LFGKKKFSTYEEAGLMWQDQKGKKYVMIFIDKRKDYNCQSLELGERSI